MAFLFCLTNLETRDLLKEEMRLRYPEWRIAFSENELLTFKAEKVKTWPRPFFTRISGECLNEGEVKKGEIPLPIESGKIWRGILHHPHHILKKVIELPAEAPSRAWLKMAEAHALFSIPLKKKDSVLELGSSPGGISYYLLNLGMMVTGVDKGKMDERCLAFENFKHLELTAQDLQPNKNKFDWLISDVNLSPDTVVAQAHRLIGDGTDIKGVLLTLKMTKSHFINNLTGYLQSFHQKKFQCELQLLPSHREEILLRAWRS